MKKAGVKTLFSLIVTSCLLVSSATALQFSTFSSTGEGGHVNDQVFTTKENGKVFELDAFLSVGGFDLNGAAKGTSAQLSKHSLPTGLGYTFSVLTSSDSSDAILRYTFTNETSHNVSDIKFYFYFDAEIDESNNTFFNEYAEIEGTLGNNSKDLDPDSWHVNEPGYTFGNILDNLLDASLGNSNAVSDLIPDDVSMALGFDLGLLKPGTGADIDILISEDHTVTGSFAIVHYDRDPDSQTTITLSGQAHVPIYEYYLDLGTIGQGSVDVQDGWYPKGTSITVTVAADFGWYFDHWIGNVPTGSEQDNPFTIIMDQPRTITAHILKDIAPPPLTIPEDITVEYPADLSPDGTGWATSSEARVLSPFAGHYYEFVAADTNITWYEAKLAAEEKGGYLAVITNAAENAFITSNINARSWIGGTDEATEDSWTWVDGSSFIYENWNEDAPDNLLDTEHWLEINPDGKWNDLAEVIEGKGALLNYAIEYDYASVITYVDEVYPGTGSVVQVIVRTWTAIDPYGNSVNYIQTITVVDTTPPAFTFNPPDASMEAEAGCMATYTGPVAQAEDLYDTVPVIVSDPAVPATLVGLGEHSIVWTAIDSIGNNISYTQTVTLVDTTAPVLVTPPSVILEAGEGCAATYTGPSATATDLCDATPVISSMPVMPATLTGLGDHSIVWVATDASGNTVSATQAVTLIDTTAPVLVVPSDVSLEIGTNCQATYSAPLATAADLCDTNPVVSSTPSVPATFTGIGVQAIVWTASDLSGNSVIATQTVTLIDTTAPHVEANGPYSGNEGADVPFSSAGTYDLSCAPLTYLWSFGDDVTSADANPTHDYADNGEYLVTLTVSDQNGNTDSGTAVVIIANTVPSFDAGPDRVIDEDADLSVSIAFTDPGWNDTFTAVFDWGDNSSETGSIVAAHNPPQAEGTASSAHVYELPGVYNVSITIQDDDGGKLTDSLKVTAQDAVPPIAKILAPGSTSTGICSLLSGTVEILAVAHDTHADDQKSPTPNNFESYSLYVAPGKDAVNGYEALIENAMTNILEPSVIGTWDTASKSGWYTLMLEVKEKALVDGTTKPNVTTVNVNVYVGVPQLLYTFGEDNLNKPSDVAVLETEDDVIAYIADRNNDRVVAYRLFDDHAEFVQALEIEPEEQDVKGNGKKDKAQGNDVNKPDGIELQDATHLILADSNRKRVLRIDLDALVWDEIGETVNWNKPTGVEVDEDGSIFVTDRARHNLVKLTSEGDLDEAGTALYENLKLIQPHGLEVELGQTIYIADRNNDRVLKVDSSGTPVSSIGQGYLNKPTGVEVSDCGAIIVAERNDDSIVIFGELGSVIATIDGGLFNKPENVELLSCGKVLLVVDRNNNQVEVWYIAPPSE